MYRSDKEYIKANEEFHRFVNDEIPEEKAERLKETVGRLTPRAKIRTKKRAINEIVQKMVENAENGLDYSEKCFICNSACYDDARAVADLVEATFPKLNGKVLITSIGTTIGSHTGPGTVALFFWGKKRVD